MNVLWFAVVILGAGLVQGALGFGFGLVALAVLSTFMDVRDAVLLLAVPNLFVNALLFLRLRQHFKWRDIRFLTVALIVGTPLGVVFLREANPTVLNWIVAVILITSAVQSLIPHIEHRRWHPVYLGVPSGLLAGGLSGAFGTSGPPIVAFVSSQGYGRLQYAATTQILFTIANGVRILEMLRQGLLGADQWRAAGVGVPLAVGGGFVGLLVLHRIPDRVFRKLIAALLLALGLYKLCA